MLFSTIRKGFIHKERLMSEDSVGTLNNRFSIPEESAAPKAEPTPKYRQKTENFADKEETV